ncbi:polysaccharide biosynthesis/export family protein [Allopontixanthobacter sp.]|uniref:polysaccharide biosynthesis/export family protein n=1 Tax=Allopontixanthobacter sp. TaxID=2906452 RepID=UPI002ABAECD9|nr:polysaccharide biosynthesis/export family protein [Allopontixanthobacter sp.]MDZ4307495.1 polysaccharide biosynthesis/export family protein [Allopontixanthobacter sp.]
MKAVLNLLAASGLALGVSACQSGPDNPSIPSGIAAYDAIPEKADNSAQVSGVMAPGDVLSISILQEPELRLEKVAIDDGGTIQMPLLGEVMVAGLTPAEFARELTDRLGARYLRNPQLTVNVIERAARTVTVEGEVDRPGIFAVKPGITLLGALALAESPSELARDDSIFVFRQVDGKRYGARFDLRELRNGLAPDPEILPGDTVVVGFSNSKSAFRDFLRATPLLNIFTVF